VKFCDCFSPSQCVDSCSCCCGSWQNSYCGTDGGPDGCGIGNIVQTRACSNCGAASCGSQQCLTSSCSAWANGACGTGYNGCEFGQLAQTRSCTKLAIGSACQPEAQCVADSSCDSCAGKADGTDCGKCCKCVGQRETYDSTQNADCSDLMKCTLDACSAKFTCADPHTLLADDPACGTVDCDQLDNNCRNYNDLTTGRCEGADNCKDANTVDDCTSYTNAAAGTVYGLCSVCDGNGGHAAATDDANCGTIDCDLLDAKCTAATDSCGCRDYSDLTTGRCEGEGDCKDANTADCTSPTIKADGTVCTEYSGLSGTCQSGSCVATGGVLPKCGIASGEACYGYDLADCCTNGVCGYLIQYPGIYSGTCYYDELGKGLGYSGCNQAWPYSEHCVCFNLDTCGAGETACMDTYGCIPEATTRCEHYTQQFKCGSNICSGDSFADYCCPWNKEDDGIVGNCYATQVGCEYDTPSPENKNVLGSVDDNRCKDCEDNDCNIHVDCADSACASSAACACDYGTCANDEKPEWYMSGSSCTYRCVHNDLCLPQDNPCAPDASSCAALAPTCPGTSLSLGGSVCCYNYATFDAGGYCCYAGRDADKEPCPAGGTSCSYDALGNPVLVTNNGNNICDPSHGWKCDGTSQAVDCCGDTDCAGLTCAAEGYGARIKTCKLDDPDKYTCRCGDCVENTDCVNQCCEAKINEDIDADGKKDCVDLGRTNSNLKYLCASASPTGWHECNPANIGKVFKDDDKSYICLADNSDYKWMETISLKLIMASLAFVFVAATILKGKLFKLSRRKR